MNKPRGLRVIFKGRTLQEFAQRYLTDLSATGMFVRTREPLPVGTNIRFDFRLEDSSPLLSGTAIVLWMAEESPELNLPSGMELRFESFDPESEERFEWLQMERRGVTVGREIPLEISSSSPEGLDELPTDEYDLRQDSWDTVPAPGDKTEQPFDEKKIEELIEEEVIQGEPTKPFSKLPVDGDLQTKESLDDGPEAPAAAPPQTQEESLAAGLEAQDTPEMEGERPEDPKDSEEGKRPQEPNDFGKGKRPQEPNDFGKGKRPQEPNDFEKGGGLPLNTVRTTVVYGPPRRSWTFFAMLLAIAALVGGGGIFLIQRGRTPESVVVEEPAADKQRVVRIITVPSGAAVIVDGKPAGVSPFSLTFKGQVKIRVQHQNFLSEDFEVRPEDPGWRELKDRWEIERTLKLRSDAAAKTAVASPIKEPDQGGGAKDLGAASAQASVDAGPAQGAAHRTPPRLTASRKRQRQTRDLAAGQGPDATAGKGASPDAAVPRDTAAAAPHPKDDGAAEPAESTKPAPSSGAPDKGPAEPDEPGAPVGAPPDKTIKIPSWADKQAAKKKRDAKLKKPAWMEKSPPAEGKK